MGQRSLSKRRLFGLDRSGPPPQATLAGQPLNPWTVPNAIGFVRALLIPLFLVLDFSSADGTDATAAVLFFLAGMGDYADGIAARVTGQYSRLGTLLDPIIDRALVISGVIVCWSYDLLPHWALAALLARELVMLAVGQAWIRRGLDLRINWPGRIAVGPTMLGILLGLAGARLAGELFLYAGLALAWVATVMYMRSGRELLRRERTA
ncbi:MAG: hypothetical protein NVSMB51_12330 [Solirubrobacteraceae bacterium]